MKKILLSAMSVLVVAPLVLPSFAHASSTKENINPIGASSVLAAAASSDNYQYVTTVYRKQSVDQGATAAVVFAVMSRIPGLSGVSTLVGLVEFFRQSNQEEVYIKQVQYLHPTTHMIRNEFYFYKNSNYTGLIDSKTTYVKAFG
ncbi:hypothetical protein [Paenibacillus sp. W2I17]|uniref:hypothetical protein n=1 Tax=Paenibacillus sp. W2I17 TaxID=3042311 RepID=UPI0027835D7A|nr:hypothetical protein [Paenibacillus sp. W2I17]MDQ0658918.1 hypothetical protein [Paenibacillus sp. W2I17]